MQAMHCGCLKVNRSDDPWSLGTTVAHLSMARGYFGLASQVFPSITSNNDRPVQK